jgi:2-octaprenyl-6-methoxyphenol hydroxylase
MNVCIIGDGLTGLSLAKSLINKKINVHIYCDKEKNTLITNRTIGISKNNLDFFKKEILNIKTKNIWKINEIKIYSEKIKNDKIINFKKDKKSLFFILKNHELYRSLNINLKKNKRFKKKIIHNNFFYQKLLKENKYDLIINCNAKNFIGKKYFSRSINKNYNNLAYISILKHLKIKNNTAIQIFTKYGPIAFLPISETQTSVVYSLEIRKNKFSDKEIFDLIKEYNPKFIIKKILRLNKFELKSSNLRNYYYKNILAFGDGLHQVHPLAGQGFNMIIRDIKNISQIIQNKIDLGIQLDSLIFEEFEKKTKHTNFIFSNGIDFIYEIFNFNKNIKNQSFNKVLKLLGKNKLLNNILVKYADRGLSI